MTRAFSHLIRGNVGEGLAYHPLAPIIGFQLLFGWVWFALRRKELVAPMSQRTLNLVLIGSAAALLLLWAVRIAANSLPSV